MRLRTLLVAVAIAGLVVWAVRLRRLSEAYWVLYYSHAEPRHFIGPGAGYHQAKRDKYERAARYPWLPVEPDPPEPD